MSHTGIKSVEPGMFEPQSLCPESGGIWRGMSIRPAFNSRRLSRSSARIFFSLVLRPSRGVRWLISKP
jgi:hypothetical protein